jgi:hypothetical protein
MGFNKLRKYSERTLFPIIEHPVKKINILQEHKQQPIKL